jgi:hypothetical protein
MGQNPPIRYEDQSRSRSRLRLFSPSREGRPKPTGYLGTQKLLRRTAPSPGVAKPNSIAPAKDATPAPPSCAVCRAPCSPRHSRRPKSPSLTPSRSRSATRLGRILSSAGDPLWRRFGGAPLLVGVPPRTIRYQPSRSRDSPAQAKDQNPPAPPPRRQSHRCRPPPPATGT